MRVIIKGGFTYTADYMIKEEIYDKLLSAAETFGKDNASAMLGLYLESKVRSLKGVDKYAMMMLKKSHISFETHFPSNFVTIKAVGSECEADIESYLDATKQLDGAFRYRVDILDFISGELNADNIIEKE